MNDRAFEWFLQGTCDWRNRIWNPPINKRDFENYCEGFDFILEEDAVVKYEQMWDNNFYI